jgi:multiple sugar transport system permease protein
MSKRRAHVFKYGLGDRVANAVISLFALMEILPLYWLVTSSLKHSNIIIKWPPEWFPRQITLVNYRNLFSSSHTLQWLLNSVVIAGVATIGICLFSTMAAYAFSKLRFYGRNFLFIMFISTLMLPKEVYIIPLFKVTQYLGVSGTRAGAILPNLALSFGIFLLYQHFDNIPDSLREAAKIDGAGEARIFGQIFFPLVIPGVAALCILMFVQNWNDYLWQLIQLTKDAAKTIQIGVASMQNEQMPDYGLNMAGAVYAALPLVVVFLAFQKYFTTGLTLGAVKE